MKSTFLEPPTIMATWLLSDQKCTGGGVKLGNLWNKKKFQINSDVFGGSVWPLMWVGGGGDKLGQLYRKLIAFYFEYISKNNTVTLSIFYDVHPFLVTFLLINPFTWH